MHKKLPVSFTGIFKEISNTSNNRHNDYNYETLPATKKYLENFPLKQIIFNWNALSLDLKATADPLEFQTLLKRSLFSKYNYELDCLPDCFMCKAN